MKKEQITLLVVAFNDYHECLSRLITFSSQFKDRLQIILAINTSRPCESNNIKVGEILVLHTGRNLGYFGAANYACSMFELSNKMIILANADIEFSASFFQSLFKKKWPSNVGLLGPQVRKIDGNNNLIRVNQNPQHLTRIDATAFFARRLLFSTRILSELYRLYKYKNQKSDTPVGLQLKKVYAINGSCIIFLEPYIALYGKSIFSIDQFLFNEELVIAENARINSLLVIIDSSLKVNHVAHETTGSIRFKTSNIYAYFRKSFEVVYRQYFKGKREIIVYNPGSIEGEGGTKVMLNQLLILSQHGLPVSVVGPLDKLKQRIEQSYPQSVSIREKFLLLTAIGSLVCTQKKPIVILHSEAAFISALLLALFCEHIIYYRHRQLDEVFIWNNMKSNIICSIEKFLMVHVFTHIMVPSKASYNSLKEKNLASKAYIVPNSVDLSINSIRSIIRDRNLSYLPSQIRLGCIARYDHAKGIDRLPSLLAQISRESSKHGQQIDFHLICPQAEEAHKYISNSLNSHHSDITHNIKFTVSPYYQDISVFLNAIDGYVQPSRSESFCFALAEAAATHLPLLVSDIPVFKELYAKNSNCILSQFPVSFKTTSTYINMIKSQYMPASIQLDSKLNNSKLEPQGLTFYEIISTLIT